MDLLDTFETHIRGAVSSLAAEGVFTRQPNLQAISVDLGDDERQGDITSSVALALHRHTGLEPLLLAERIADRLRAIPDIASVEIGSPGFLNLTVASSAWAALLASLLAAGGDYGRSQEGGGRAIEIAFLPTDPGTPLPANFSRCSAVGDALANLLDFVGFRASRHYRLNGKGVAGMTVKLGNSAGLIVLGDLKACNDAARFGMLMHRAGAVLDLDLDLMSDPSNDNPLFRVQYAHARCWAIRQKASQTFPDLAGEGDWDISAFADEGARLILKRLALYPRKIDQAIRAGEPHWLALYLHELAGVLHSQYYRSLNAPHLRFIRDDDRLLTGARLAVVRGVETILKSGLALLGVSAPDEMR